jgi:enoyl-CoA hydratase
MKIIVNQAYENMGLSSTQILGPILDGLMRERAVSQAGNRML